jgi:hypothetical protein
MSPPSSALLATCFMLVPCLARSSTLKKEAVCSSETLVDFKWATRHYIPGDLTLRLITVFILNKVYSVYR